MKRHTGFFLADDLQCILATPTPSIPNLLVLSVSHALKTLIFYIFSQTK